jgi:hypothetical protein
MAQGPNEFTWFSGAVPLAGTYVYPDVFGQELRNIAGLAVSCEFTYGSGGTTIDVYAQTSLDGGSNWIDVICFHLTTASARKGASVRANVTSGSSAITPTDGTLTANTVQDGVVGGRWRVKVKVAGTYVASTLAIAGTCVRK